MSSDDMKKIKQIDAVAEKAGGFVAFLQNEEVHYDMRKINEHCKKMGIEPVDMTIRELNTFIVN